MLSSIKPTTANLVVRGLLAPLPVFLALYMLFSLYFYGSYFGYMKLLNVFYQFLPITITLTLFVSGLLFIKVCYFMDSEEAQADEVNKDRLIISLAGFFCATFYLGVVWLVLRCFVL